LLTRSVDVERISEGVEFIHEVWASLVSIALGLVLLYSQVSSACVRTQKDDLNTFIKSQASWAAFMPLAVIVITLSAASLMGSAMGKHQATWLAATDRRIKLIVSDLSLDIYLYSYAIQVFCCLEPDTHQDVFVRAEVGRKSGEVSRRGNERSFLVLVSGFPV
jgi:amino acid transporter